MAQSFHGGIRLHEDRALFSAPLEAYQAGEFLRFPLWFDGILYEPSVGAGETVKKGQSLLRAHVDGRGFDVHAPVSGRVLKVGSVEEEKQEAVLVLENDFKEERCDGFAPFSASLAGAKPEELEEFMRVKGLVDPEGETTPLFLRVAGYRGKTKNVIISCGGQDTGIAVHHRLIIEHPEEVVGGAKILLRALAAERAVFAVSTGREEEIEALLNETKDSDAFGILPCRPEYPAAHPALLYRAAAGKKIPPHTDPAEEGMPVFSALLCFFIYRAFVLGEPQITSALSVSGESVAKPANLLLPIGVSANEAIDRCGGKTVRCDKLLAGGVMRGTIADGARGIATRQTTAFCAASPESIPAAGICLSCGRCLGACPMQLDPKTLYASLRKEKKRDKAKKRLQTYCIACGCCSFVCPAKIPLTESFRRMQTAQEE